MWDGISGRSDLASMTALTSFVCLTVRGVLKSFLRGSAAEPI